MSGLRVLPWIAALAGSLVGYRRGVGRQLTDAAIGALSLGLAYWQYPRMIPVLRRLMPGYDNVPLFSFVYLFVVLYALWGLTATAYLPRTPRSHGRRWWNWGGALIGGVQGGLLVQGVLAFFQVPGT